MKIIATTIPEVLIIEPKVFGDERGYFFESFNAQVFRTAIGREVNFVQDNHSRSVKGVLRGLHYQLPPMAQGKLVRCTLGEVFDVAVDLRRGSPTFGQSVSCRLSAANKLQMWIPEGFAHGFLVVSDVAEFQYKVTEYYAPKQERTLRWDDPSLAIDWPSQFAPVLSDKDAVGKFFPDIDFFP